MENSVDILNELKEISPVIAGIGKRNVFTVPAGYFENLGKAVLINVQESTGSVLGSIGNPSSVQEVPQGYFESLAGNILNKIKAADSAAVELNTLSPMLHSIQNKNVFTVPEGYFQSLSQQILNTVQPQQATVVTMRRRSTTILKYALAAVFTGAMALGVYKFTGIGVQKVALPAYVTAGQKINNVDEELAKINDEDIIKYLQINGNDVDAALVAGSIDGKELPTQEDYLTDDKALDKYLDNVDLKDLKN
jgi:hypothetical protein